MSPLKADKTQIRATIDRTVYDLLKGLAGIKKMSLSELVADALNRYLEEVDNKELIEYHRLEGREED